MKVSILTPRGISMQFSFILAFFSLGSNISLIHHDSKSYHWLKFVQWASSQLTGLIVTLWHVWELFGLVSNFYPLKPCQNLVTKRLFSLMHLFANLKSDHDNWYIWS
ncbi:hypothetical protein ABZP36_032711 [Zizania latifolia]